MPVSNNNPYTECELFINAEWLVKETDKSWCFKLWGKKFLAFPKSLIKGFDFTGKTYKIVMWKWFVEKNQIQSLLDKEVKKMLFPTKKELKAQESNLFNELETIKKTKPIKPSLEQIKDDTQFDLPDWMR